MRNREIRSVTYLLEKLVNGFPLVSGSTFEQVEEKACWPQGLPQIAWPVPSRLAVLCSRLLTGVLPELACPRDQAMWSLGSLPPQPLKGGGRCRTSLGNPSCPLIGGVVWEHSLTQASCFECWQGEGSLRTLRAHLSQLRPGAEG